MRSEVRRKPAPAGCVRSIRQRIPPPTVAQSAEEKDRSSHSTVDSLLPQQPRDVSGSTRVHGRGVCSGYGDPTGLSAIADPVPVLQRRLAGAVCQHFSEHIRIHRRCVSLGNWSYTSTQHSGPQDCPQEGRGLVHFTRRRRINKAHPLRLPDITITPAQSCRYLGLQMDNGLNWRDHIQHIQ